MGAREITLIPHPAEAGRGGPRGSPWTAALHESGPRERANADEGVGSGPGGLPEGSAQGSALRGAAPVRPVVVL
jgi:hypothetical protein